MPSRRSMLQENEGCLLHLPLSFDGDLSDRITGAALELSGNGSITWDATGGMYLIKNPATIGQYVARLAIDLYPYKFPTNSFTTIGQIKRKSTSGSQSAFSKPPINVTYNATESLNVYPSTVVNVATVIDDINNNRTYYQNNTLYKTYTETVAYLPSNWSYDGFVYIGYISNSFYYNKEYYIKDYYLFNRVLTAEEIYKIQGY